jgi:hypothetical protein
MYFSRVFFACFLITACSAHAMENKESLPVEKNTSITLRRTSASFKRETPQQLKKRLTLFRKHKNQALLLQLIDNTRALRSIEEDILIMEHHLKALSLTNKKWYKTLNSFPFTNLFIQAFARCFNLYELNIANTIKTAGAKNWVNQYLKDLSFP